MKDHTANWLYGHGWLSPMMAMLLVASPLAFAGSAEASPMLVLTQAPSPGSMTLPGQVPEFRRIADEFIYAAAAGDANKVTRMLSAKLRERTGADSVQRYVVGQLLPFFAPFKELAKSVTITLTADVAGFAFYMYMVSGNDELHPFVIYVTQEADSKVVANILVDKFVEGRHCTHGAAGWRCPDFR
jgi:hypothetical protein